MISEISARSRTSDRIKVSSIFRVGWGNFGYWIVYTSLLSLFRMAVLSSGTKVLVAMRVSI